MNRPVVNEDGAQLQPPPRGAVPTSWLDQFADTVEARRLAELEADNELLNRLMWSGWIGPEWDTLADRLIAYGYTVVSSWLRKGIVFDRCEDRGIYLRRTQRCRQQPEASSLAGETVAVSVVKFRETVLIPRVWRPDGGSTLDTFFIGQCLIRFPNVYRRWLKENGWGGADALDDVSGRRAGDETLTFQSLRSGDPVGQPGARIGREALVQLASDGMTQRILDFVADDFTYEEIALLLGTTVPAIKSRLYRLRRTLENAKDEPDAP